MSSLQFLFSRCFANMQSLMLIFSMELLGFLTCLFKSSSSFLAKVKFIIQNSSAPTLNDGQFLYLRGDSRKQHNIFPSPSSKRNLVKLRGTQRINLLSNVKEAQNFDDS